MKYEEDSSGYGTYFDGTNLNGNPGTVFWNGTADDAESMLQGTDVLTGDLAYTGPPLSGASLYVDTLSGTDVLTGHAPLRDSETINPNPAAPAVPTVTLVVDDALGEMILAIDANDGSHDPKTTSFDVFRNGVRVATRLVPDQTTRLASFTDVPASGETATYVVRALASSGGWADQTDGTVV